MLIESTLQNLLVLLRRETDWARFRGACICCGEHIWCGSRRDAVLRGAGWSHAIRYRHARLIGYSAIENLTLQPLNRYSTMKGYRKVDRRNGANFISARRSCAEHTWHGLGFFRVVSKDILWSTLSFPVARHWLLIECLPQTRVAKCTLYRTPLYDLDGPLPQESP